MDFKYKKLMEENDLRLNQLPQDAQTGVEEINKVLRGITMRERDGKKVLPSTLKKLAAMDKWVAYEILDHLHDTDKNDDEIPFDSNDVLKDIKKPDLASDDKLENKTDNPSPNQNNKEFQKGLKIEAELDKLLAEGKIQLSIDDLRSLAPNTYSEIWDNYEEGEENGIITSKYSLIEDKDYEFNLKLK
jgi:hypothetical protein